MRAPSVRSCVVAALATALSLPVVAQSGHEHGHAHAKATTGHQHHGKGAAALLPPSVYAALQIGGIADAAQTARGWPIGAMLRDMIARLPAERRDETMQGLDEGAANVGGVLAQIGVEPADFRDLMSCPMTVAIGRPTTVGMGPSVALLLEVGERAAAVDRVFEALVAIGLQTGTTERPAAQLPAVTGAVGLREFAGAEGVPLFRAGIDGTLVFTNSLGLLQELAAVAAGNAPALAAQAPIAELPQRLGAQPAVSLFLNTDRLMGMFEPLLPYEAADWADALGIGRLGHVYATVGADAHGGVDQVGIAMGGAATGLLKAASSKPADLAFAELCTDNTVLFAAQSLDLAAVLDAARKILPLLPERARVQIEHDVHRDLTRDLQASGLTPEGLEAMVRAFGDQVAVALALEPGPIPKPEVLGRIAVRERGLVADVMARFEAAVSNEQGVQWKSRKVDDHEVRYFSLPIEDKLQLTPCYVVTDQALLFGTEVMALTRALRRSGDAETSLANQQDFQAVRKDFAGAGRILHLRAFRLAELGWRSVETFVYPQLDAQRDQNGFGSEILPDMETVSAALGSTTFATFVDDRGVTQKHRGLLTLGAAAATFAVLVDELLLRVQ